MTDRQTRGGGGGGAGHQCGPDDGPAVTAQRKPVENRRIFTADYTGGDRVEIQKKKTMNNIFTVRLPVTPAMFIRPYRQNV